MIEIKGRPTEVQLKMNLEELECLREDEVRIATVIDAHPTIIMADTKADIMTVIVLVVKHPKRHLLLPTTKGRSKPPSKRTTTRNRLARDDPINVEVDLLRLDRPLRKIVTIADEGVVVRKRIANVNDEVAEEIGETEATRKIQKTIGTKNVEEEETVGLAVEAAIQQDEREPVRIALDPASIPIEGDKKSFFGVDGCIPLPISRCADCGDCAD